MGLFGSIGRALSNPDSLAMIGATLKDVGASLNGDDGNSALLVRKMLTDRQALAQKQEFARRLGGLIGSQYPGAQTPPIVDPRTQGQGPTPPPGAMVINPAAGGGRLTIDDPRLPALALEAQANDYDMGNLLSVLKAQQPKVPDARYVEGPDGIYLVDQGGARKIQSYPGTAPTGYRLGANGQSLEYIPGGPADPSVIGRNAGTRRDVVVARPMPRVGGGGKGRAAPKPRSYGADDVSW